MTGTFFTHQTSWSRYRGRKQSPYQIQVWGHVSACILLKPWRCLELWDQMVFKTCDLVNVSLCFCRKIKFGILLRSTETSENQNNLQQIFMFYLLLFVFFNEMNKNSNSLLLILFILLTQSQTLFFMNKKKHVALWLFLKDSSDSCCGFCFWSSSCWSDWFFCLRSHSPDQTLLFRV